MALWAETRSKLATMRAAPGGASSDPGEDGCLLSLSDLVLRTGVPASTIHHYRRAALIPPPIRSALNRFGYDERHVMALRLVRLLRERRGLSLEDIGRQLPDLQDRPEVLAELAGAFDDNETDVAWRLTDAAIDAFQTRSYGEVTISDIAEAAGVAKGSVYRHFASKEDVFTAAIERVLTRTADEFAGTVARLGGAAGLARVPETTAAEFAGVVAQAMPMLLELGTRAAKGNKPSEVLARRVLRTLAEATGRPLVTGTDDDPIAAGLAVIQMAFAVMLDWAVGTDWPPDDEPDAPSRPSAPAGLDDERQGEPVVALGTHGLDGGDIHAG
jgi:AcrR family transcriptional regulator